MKIITVYEPFNERDANGNWYTEWQVPEGMPLQGNFIQFGPGEDLKFPRFDFASDRWVEDEAAVNEMLLKENNKLKVKIENMDAQLTDAQIAIAEVFEIVAGGETNG